MSPSIQGLAPSRALPAHRVCVRDCVNRRWIFTFVTGFQPCHTGLSRQGSARFQDLNSTLLKCRAQQKGSPVVSDSWFFPRTTGLASACWGTVMCGVCGAEDRWRPPGVRVISPNPAFPQHLPCPGVQS